MPYQLQCLADLEQSFLAAGITQYVSSRWGWKIPSKKGNYFDTVTVSFTWCPQKEEVLYTDFPPMPFSQSPIFLLRSNTTHGHRKVLSQLRNIKPLAGPIRIPYCLMQALKNKEGVIRYLTHTSQLHTFTAQPLQCCLHKRDHDKHLLLL